MREDSLQSLTSLQTRVAKRVVTAALIQEGILEGAQLGGDFSAALADVPPSRLRSRRAEAAFGIAIKNIQAELDALMRRATTCFIVSTVMGLVLAGTILWMAVSGSVDSATTLATLSSTAGGGGAFAYYKYVSKQADSLRKDLLNLSRDYARRSASSRSAQVG